MTDFNNLPNASEIYQQAMKVLRLHFFSLMPKYLAGLIPFQIFILYFFLELSIGFHDGTKIFLLSIVTFLLFCFFKVMQSVYSTHLYHLINEKKINVKFDLREIFYQISIQATAPFVYLLGLITTITLQASINFYCNSQVVTENKQQLSLSQRLFDDVRELKYLVLNIGITLHGLIFALIVFVNFIVIVVTLPYLLNSFFGIESVFIKSGQTPLNLISYLVIFNFTFMICDPIIKAAMVLRCYYRNALPTGEDLSYRVSILTKAVVIISFVLLPCVVNSNEHKTGENIEKVLSQKKYQWRDSKPKEEINFTEKLDFLDSIVEGISEFFRNLFESKEKKKKRDGQSSILSGFESTVFMKFLLLVILVIIIALIIKSFVLSKKKGLAIKPEVIIEMQKFKPDESRYDEYSADEWEKTARERLAAGDFRGAIRALYFHTLLSLGKQNLVHIQRYKTNLQYRHELKSRSHHFPEVYPLFISMIIEFEKAWFSEENVQEFHFVNFKEQVASIKRNLK